MRKRIKLLFVASLIVIGIGASMSERSANSAQKKGASSVSPPDAERVLAIKCVDVAKAGIHDPTSAEIPDPLSIYDYPSKFYIGERSKGVTTVQFEMRAKNGFNALRIFTVDCQWKKTKEGGYTLAKFNHWQSR